jgi:hypothetical protein
MDFWAIALNRVDFPTFGSPTSATLTFMEMLLHLVVDLLVLVMRDGRDGVNEDHP